MITRRLKGWYGSWRHAADPQDTRDAVLGHALAMLGAVLGSAALLLTALTDWRFVQWRTAVSGDTGMTVKGTVLMAAPALYFAVVTTNAVARSRLGTPGLRWVAVVASVLSVGSGLLFWALPVLPTD